MGIENPKISLDLLNNIESKIKDSKETPEDLELLNYFISSVEKDYIISKMRDNGINSYESYLSERKKTYDKQNSNIPFIVGYLMAVISHLKKSIT